MFPCYDEFLRWWYLLGAPLIHSGVGCLCNGKLDILYLAEMMNHFIFFVVLNSLTGQWRAIYVHSWPKEPPSPCKFISDTQLGFYFDFAEFG